MSELQFQNGSPRPLYTRLFLPGIRSGMRLYGLRDGHSPVILFGSGFPEHTTG